MSRLEKKKLKNTESNMFSGIVEERGIIRSCETDLADGVKVSVECSYDFEEISIGDSLCVDGVCLTVVNKHKIDDGKILLSFDISEETLRKTTFNKKNKGDLLNLERSLKVGDRLHGHIVSGHVDCVGILKSRTEERGSFKLEFTSPPQYEKYITQKGSITISGVSLTVGEVSNGSFCVYIIPHTSTVTTLGLLNAGDVVNIEVDMIARYVEKILHMERVS